MPWDEWPAIDRSLGRRDVTAGVVRVVQFFLRGGEHRFRQDEVAEAWRKPLDLCLDALTHVDGGT